MEKHISTWAGGIDTDSTKALVKPNKYRTGTNIRLITESLDSSGAITNASGTLFSFRIPTTSNVVKIEQINFSLSSIFNIQGAPFNQIFTDFSDVAKVINADPTIIAAGLKAVASNTQVLVYSLLNTSNVTITTNIAFSLTPTNAVITNLIASQPNPIIIGSTPLRDDFIIFTTTDISKNPGGHTSALSADASSAGQLWRLSYDQITFSSTLELLYNNIIDFTTFHPIPPSATEGRHETSNIQRVYWTDNYNELRSFDTKNTDGFALDPSLLDSRPNLDFDIPILQKINDSGGVLVGGIYQAAYRLKNTGGATTIYSKASNMVPVMFDPSTVSFRLLGNSSTSVTAKSITWNIDNLDTDYERIEIVILFRGTREAIPTIDQVFDEPVPSSGNFTFTYTGNETTTPVDLNDFLNVNSAFTHCKTIISKTNQLLAGNVRNKTFDVDFDARAYRFNAHPNSMVRHTRLEDSQGGFIQITADNVTTNPTTWGNIVPEDHDTINKNTPLGFDQYTQDYTGYKWQSDGVTLGGEGLNIKYTFTTKFILGDVVTGFSTTSLDATTAPVGENSRFTNPDLATFILNNNSFSNNGLPDSFKSWYKASALKGYQRDEIYRFAIRFFDKKGRPGFAKWIADIRMPLIFETLALSPFSQTLFQISTGTAYGQALGIIVPVFTVNIPASIKNKISGWEIVRTERTINDKTIMAAGTIHQAVFDTASVSHYLVETDENLPSNTTPPTYNSTSKTVDENAFFKSPEFMFGTFPGHQQGDKIKIVADLNVTYQALSTTPASPNEFILDKNYTHTAVYDNSMNSPISDPFMQRNLGDATQINRDLSANTVITVAGLNVNNRTNEGGAASSARAVGDSSVFLDWRVDSPIYWTSVQNSRNKFYAYYIRPRTSQYGGNTYSQRATNTYISCGHYQEVNSNSPSTFTAEIAGGDIFTVIFDTQAQIKNWVLGTVGKRSVSFFFPVETVLNTEWRYGNSVNKSGMNNDGSNTGGDIDLGEDFLINTVWSAEDNVKPAFIKPVQFTDVQEYDTRVHISSVKINGEVTDSWGNFPPFDFMDMEGSKGPVTSLHLLKDNIYVIQNNAVSVLPVNPNILFPVNFSSTLQLGTGKVLEKPVYIATSEGSRHQWSCLTTDSAIYFFDVKTLQIMKMTDKAEPLVTTKGLDSFFTNNLLGSVITGDNPIHDTTLNPRAGILSTYDYQNADVLFTFHDIQNSVKKAYTVAFSELINSFTSFYDFTPTAYISNYKTLFSVQPRSSTTPIILQDQVWIHGEGNPGEFYGTKFPCKISFLVNPQPSKTKVFDNLEWITEITDISNSNTNILNETWSTIRVFNDHQNTDLQTLTPNTNLKRRERTWNMQVPRNRVISSLTSVNVLDPLNLTTTQLFQDRLRDKYIQVDITFNSFNNTVFRKLICPYILTKYRISAR